jgi:hypothetical protein
VVANVPSPALKPCVHSGDKRARPRATIPSYTRELVPILRSHQADTRKSVAKCATKLVAQLQ